MKKKIIYYKNYINKDVLSKKVHNNFNRDFDRFYKNITQNLNKIKNTFHVFSKDFKLDYTEKKLKKFKRFKTIGVIGMGGSILGAKAIYQFLSNKIKTKAFFIDNLDDASLNQIKQKNLKKILFIIISKSGNTIETISNLFALGILKKNSKNIIIISEKKKSILAQLAQKYGILHINHKNYLGGRYSVLSEVGIIPSYFFEINIKQLRENLQVHLKSNNKYFLKESTLILANLLAQKKYKNLVMLNYVPELENFLFWYQQLVAESLGKKNKGFLPIVSNTPKDHHSLLQLYLDGPKDKIFYIFSSKEKSKNKIYTKKIIQNIDFLHGKDLNLIKSAQKNAVIKTLKENNIPFREFVMNFRNEKVLGELFAYFMLETAIAGKIVKINPFDQPSVEQIKNYTKKILI